MATITPTTFDAILAQTRAMIKNASATSTKKASGTGADGGKITGMDPATMPGSENDSTPDASAGNSDPEVNDGSMVPGTGLSTDGAGDPAGELTHGHAVDVDTAVLTPTKKPLESADVNAKEASPLDLCHDILGMITTYNKQAEAPAAPVAKPVAKVATAAPAAPVAVEQKSGGLNMELTSDVMAKIAAVMLSTDEGVAAVEALLAKSAGAEAADSMMGFLANQNELAEKTAAYNEGAASADDLIMRQIYAAGQSDGFAKSASQNQFYKQGQDFADGAIDDVMTQGGGEQDVSPEELAALGGEGGEGEMGGEGDITEEDLADITEEDIIGGIQDMVAAGELQPEQAEEILTKIMESVGAEGGEGEMGGEGELPPEAMGGEEMAPEGLEGLDPTKTASALLASVQRFAQAKAAR